MDDWGKALAAGAVAAAGGLVAYLQQFTNRNLPPEMRPRWHWGAACIKVVTAGFTGLLTFWLIGKRGLDENFVHFMVAIAGYGGVEALEFFKQVFYETIRRVANTQQLPPPAGAAPPSEGQDAKG